MAPSCTVILTDLGLPGSLVAVDSWSARQYGHLRDLPSFDMMDPDIEQIAALAPDILLVSTMTQAGANRDPFKPLSDMGIQVIYFPTSESLADIKRDVRRIADITGTKDQGEKIVADMEATIEEIASVAQTIPETDRKTVFFEISAAPFIYSFGQGVYLNELLELAGTDNILKDETGWAAVNAETVFSRDPEVILTNVSYLLDPIPEIKSRPGWKSLRAVKNNRVYYIDNIKSSQPAPAVIGTLKEIAGAVYPEYFHFDDNSITIE
ncbi:ABC transporter substrate-binding protein [Brucepastera parasyntrophica]|uniref:ABC transporter substrate-binding protein n=1 Tax=Brucepastera parasyntrophica TaxID=2880008 RepID=UPI00210BA23F|nr:ABC transporter substrate-binding protein [Brucepastera parasyntrophica]ULQ58492.1 ABC transporter substrate-binding protein [Brucepastera parasyntrophica]